MGKIPKHLSKKGTIQNNLILECYQNVHLKIFARFGIPLSYALLSSIPSLRVKE